VHSRRRGNTARKGCRSWPLTSGPAWRLSYLTEVLPQVRRLLGQLQRHQPRVPQRVDVVDGERSGSVEVWRSAAAAPPRAARRPQPAQRGAAHPHLRFDRIAALATDAPNTFVDLLTCDTARGECDIC
jgi:uncharacterized membrane protein YccC